MEALEARERGQKLYGNNRVLFGRFVTGPDVRSCVATLLLICVPSLFWQFEVGTFFSTRYSIFFPVAAALCQVFSVYFLVATALSDPGIMPRQKTYTDHWDARTKSFRQRVPARHYDLLLRGHPFKLKYCVTCNIYRPPRCTHCSVCENCIERFDHHCPWIGNCIGKRNYWLFYSFVMSLGIMNVFVLVTSVVQLVVLCMEFVEKDNVGGGDGLVSAMREAPVAAALAIYCIAIVWFTVGLGIYHNYLIFTNQTTYEQIKGAYSNGNNPFHRGIYGNCRDILCSRVRRRYFDPASGRLLWPMAAAASQETIPPEQARDIKLTEPKQLAHPNDQDVADIPRHAGDISSEWQGPRDSAQACDANLNPASTYYQ